MPIFEYHCSACGADFEALVYGGKTPECPKCGNAEPSKKLSLFGMSGVEKPFAGSPSASCGSCSKGSCSSCH